MAIRLKTWGACRWVRAEATLTDSNRTGFASMIEQRQRPIMVKLTHTVGLSHWPGDRADEAFQAFVGDPCDFVGLAAGASHGATIICGNVFFSVVALTLAKTFPRPSQDNGFKPAWQSPLNHRACFQRAVIEKDG